MLHKLDQSENLHDLEQILSSSKQGFGFDCDKRIEGGKVDLESSVQKGQYSQVAQNRESYEQLIRQMQQASQNMEKAMEEGHKRIDKIMVIKDNVGKRLNDIVDNCLEIDVRGDGMSLKRQKLNEELEA